VVYQVFGHGVPFWIAALIVAVALGLSWRVRHQAPIPATASSA
jgi:hypothetical protein